MTQKFPWNSMESHSHNGFKVPNNTMFKHPPAAPARQPETRSPGPARRVLRPRPPRRYAARRRRRAWGPLWRAHPSWSVKRWKQRNVDTNNNDDNNRSSSSSSSSSSSPWSSSSSSSSYSYSYSYSYGAQNYRISGDNEPLGPAGFLRSWNSDSCSRSCPRSRGWLHSPNR